VQALPLGVARLVGEFARDLLAAILAARLVFVDLPPRELARKTVARLCHRTTGKTATSRLR
jgi:hypothetical protein